jgi:hypothetical protein
MKEYPVDPKVREMWKTFPLRLSGLATSPCCGSPTVLVQSMDGGFVTRNCARCGAKDSFPEADFMRLGLWVACPVCKQPMTATRLHQSNYGYLCKPCDLGIKLAELLPRWTDI